MKRGSEAGMKSEGGGEKGKKREKKKKTSGFSRGSQSVECLMKSLEEVPRSLQRKTQNHSVGGRDREKER